LPFGYHSLVFEPDGERYSAMLISAPRRAFTAKDRLPRTWGAFLPLYGLHSSGSWGGGNFTDLQSLASLIAAKGGSLVATLPLLSAFLDEASDPSPYAPVSRLFWNEFYIDLSRVPELEHCPRARALLESA